MLEIVNTIIPVFLVMALGYGAVRGGYLSQELSDSLNALTVRVAVPILLFRAIYNLDFDAAFNWSVLFGYYLGAIASFTVTILLAKTFFKRRPGESIAVGFSAMFSNTVLLGIPIAERAFGAEIMPVVFGIIALHAPSLYTVGIISMEFTRSDGRAIGDTLKIALGSIFANPLMIGILSGAVLNKLAIGLPAPLEASIDMVAQAAIPVALIGIGAALTKYELKSGLRETAMVSFISLVVHPAIVFILSFYVMGLQIHFVQTAVIIAAMPPGMNIYIFSAMYNRAVALSASTIILATLGSIFTISGWLWILSLL